MLEVRQLLTDPMAEMNSKLYSAILMSNEQMASYFSSGPTEVAGKLNNAIGEVSSDFVQFPLNGAEIEEDILTDVSATIGDVESSSTAGTTAISSGRLVMSKPGAVQFEIGLQMPMMYPMPGVVYGSHGYFVMGWDGTFSATSQWVYEVPSTIAGIATTRISVEGTMNRSSLGDTYNVKVDYLDLTPTNQTAHSWHVETSQTLNGSTPSTSTFATFSDNFGPVTTSGTVKWTNDVVEMYSVGGTAVLGDATVTLSKSHMNGHDRLFGTIDYLAGQTKATVRIGQIDALTAASATVTKYFDTMDQYFRIGGGTVSGTAANGQAINDSYGSIVLAAPIKKVFPWSEGRLYIQSSWHNGTGTPLFSNTPPDVDSGTLFILHDYLHDDIIGHVNQVVVGTPLLSY